MAQGSRPRCASFLGKCQGIGRDQGSSHQHTLPACPVLVPRGRTRPTAAPCWAAPARICVEVTEVEAGNEPSAPAASGYSHSRGDPCPRAHGATLLQTPALYPLGYGALLLASPLEAGRSRWRACPRCLAGCRHRPALCLDLRPRHEFLVSSRGRRGRRRDAAWEQLLFRGLAFDVAARRCWTRSRRRVTTSCAR